MNNQKELKKLIRSELQIARQNKDFRVKGRYAKVNPCEICKKSAGVEYYSHPDCNTNGLFVCLCEKCAKKVGSLNMKDAIKKAEEMSGRKFK